MKSLIISIICLLPLTAYAHDSLQDVCKNKGFVYKDNVEIVGLLATEEIINTKNIMGGVEIKENNQSPVGYVISDGNYYLYSLAKSAFAINEKVNVCVSPSSMKQPYAFLYGIEMRSSSK